MRSRRLSSSTGKVKLPLSTSGWPARKISKMVSQSYLKLLRRPFLAALLFLPLSAQSNKQYLAVGELPKVAGKRTAAIQAKIPLTVQTGYHVNSNAPKDEYLIPLKLTWKDTGALEAGQVA